MNKNKLFVTFTSLLLILFSSSYFENITINILMYLLIYFLTFGITFYLIRKSELINKMFKLIFVKSRLVLVIMIYTTLLIYLSDKPIGLSIFLGVSASILIMIDLNESYK